MFRPIWLAVGVVTLRLVIEILGIMTRGVPTIRILPAVEDNSLGRILSDQVSGNGMEAGIAMRPPEPVDPPPLHSTSLLSHRAAPGSEEQG